MLEIKGLLFFPAMDTKFHLIVDKCHQIMDTFLRKVLTRIASAPRIMRGADDASKRNNARKACFAV